MIIYKKGNLIDTPDIALAHGCNAQGVMGAGVAKDIRQKFPEAYDAYRLIDGYCGLDIGTIVPVKIYRRTDLGTICNVKYIYNCITQEYYGNQNKVYVDYQAIRDCMFELSNSLVMEHITSLSIPKIGSGWGGGDWNIIEEIIKDKISDKITVNVWEL